MPLASLYVCSLRSRTDTYYPWLREGKKTRIEKMCFGSIISSRGIPFLLEEERERERERKEKRKKKSKRSAYARHRSLAAEALQKRCRGAATVEKSSWRVPPRNCHARGFISCSCRSTFRKKRFMDSDGLGALPSQWLRTGIIFGLAYSRTRRKQGKRGSSAETKVTSFLGKFFCQPVTENVDAATLPRYHATTPTLNRFSRALLKPYRIKRGPSLLRVLISFPWTRITFLRTEGSYLFRIFDISYEKNNFNAMLLINNERAK